MGFSEFVNGFANAVFDKAASYDQKEMARKLHCASDYEIEKFLRKSRNGEFSALASNLIEKEARDRGIF